MMRRAYARLAATCALAVATASFTGAALADPGNGNSANAPGQVKQEQAAQPQAQQPTAQTQAPGQVKKAQATQQSPGQGKQAAKASTPSAGVKPSSTTKKWTHTTVGANPDVSKRYGNGKTAAQIAHSRGAPDSQPLTGPGNSQPHKTTACGKPSNKSGGVDVHAIKSYDAANCQTQAQTQTQAPAVVTTPPAAPCGFTFVQQQSLLGMMHVNGKGRDVHLMTNTHSAHFQGKHEGDHPVFGTTLTLVPDTSQVCSQTQAPQVQQVTPVTVAQVQSSSQAALGALPATQGMPTAAAPATGNVLGAQTTLASPKPAAHHGVLGTVTRVAGASLPFTGFPVWAAMLVALVLIGGGVAVRRRAGARS
jgi:hypothetical protein